MKQKTLFLILAVLAFGVIGYWFLIQNRTSGNGIAVNITCLSKNQDVRSCAIGEILVKTTEGKEVIRQAISRNSFKLSLEPGDYIVIPISNVTDKYVPISNLQNVQIKSGQFVKLEFRYMERTKNEPNVQNPIIDSENKTVLMLGGSMEPAFSDHDVLKAYYEISQLKRGDIIAFKFPNDPKQIFVKRIVGLPEETITISGGKVFINGSQLNETLYVNGDTLSKETKFQLGGSQYFVLGDNRKFSLDSRIFGPLPMANIIARVIGKH